MVIFTPRNLRNWYQKMTIFFQAGSTFSKPSCWGPPAVSFRGSIFLKHCQDRWYPFEGGRVGIPDFAYCSILITSITRFESYLISLQKLYSVSTCFFDLIRYQKLTPTLLFADFSYLPAIQIHILFRVFAAAFLPNPQSLLITSIGIWFRQGCRIIILLVPTRGQPGWCLIKNRLSTGPKKSDWSCYEDCILAKLHGFKRFGIFAPWMVTILEKRTNPSGCFGGKQIVTHIQNLTYLIFCPAHCINIQVEFTKSFFFCVMRV